MKHSEFVKLVERYRRYDNRALVIALAESYGKRDGAYASLRYCRNALSVLNLSSDTAETFSGMVLGLKLAIKHSEIIYEYEEKRSQAIMNVMESRNFHIEQYCCADFPVPDNWDMLDKSNPEYPPIDIKGVTI